MQAIVKFARGEFGEQLREIVMQLVPFEFHQPKSFDTRCVHEVTAFGQSKHLGKSGGVLALLVRTRDVTRFQFKAGQ